MHTHFHVYTQSNTYCNRTYCQCQVGIQHYRGTDMTPKCSGTDGCTQLGHGIHQGQHRTPSQQRGWSQVDRSSGVDLPPPDTCPGTLHCCRGMGHSPFHTYVRHWQVRICNTYRLQARELSPVCGHSITKYVLITSPRLIRKSLMWLTLDDTSRQLDQWSHHRGGDTRHCGHCICHHLHHDPKGEREEEEESVMEDGWKIIYSSMIQHTHNKSHRNKCDRLGEGCGLGDRYTGRIPRCWCRCGNSPHCDSHTRPHLYSVR